MKNVHKTTKCSNIYFMNDIFSFSVSYLGMCVRACARVCAWSCVCVCVFVGVVFFSSCVMFVINISISSKYISQLSLFFFQE